MKKLSENNQLTESEVIPENWEDDIHKLWLSGQVENAIKACVEKFNSITEEKKPKGLLVQFSYYLFLINDFKSSSTILKTAHELYPDDKEVLLNFAISLSRAKFNEEAIKTLKKLLKEDPMNFVAWDSIANSYHRIGEFEKSTRSGNNSLRIKDKRYGIPDDSWELPKEDISVYTKDKKRVIAFSLRGNEKRYIFGALRNLLLAPDLFPEWKLWFYVDNSVSLGFLDIIKQLGGHVLLQPDNQTQREKLCCHFNVANDETVGYFLVRDAGSVFSLREANAVEEWLQSGKWFHIIRDWWTHTDLILAGLWGGVAGVLPNIKDTLNRYSPNSVITPNINQWFLRDCLWRYIKISCLTHDRCFNFDGNAQPVPGNIPTDNIHIGACEYDQRPELQEKLLSTWIQQGRPSK